MAAIGHSHIRIALDSGDSVDCTSSTTRRVMKKTTVDLDVFLLSVPVA